MHLFVRMLYEQLWSSSINLVGKRLLWKVVFSVVFSFLSSSVLTCKMLGWFPWLEHYLEQLFFYSCFSLFLAFSCHFYFAWNRNKISLMTFKELFHYGAVYVVFKERQQHLTFLSRKNEVQMIFEVSEENIKILHILFNEKLQITYTFRCNPLWKPYARFMHLITEMKPQRWAIITLMYAMSTIENHWFENESEISYIVKWFKAHNLTLIGKHTLTCLILPKMMLPIKYDPLARFVTVWWRCLENQWFLVRVSGKVPYTRCKMSLASSFFTGFKN